MKVVWIILAVLSAIACGVLGYLLVKRQSTPLRVRPVVNRTTEDANAIDELLKVDPKLIIAKEAGRVSTGFKELRGVAAGPDDRIYAVGDKTLAVFGADGAPEAKIDLADHGLCVAVGADSTRYVGLRTRVEVFDSKGARAAAWPDLGPKAWITSIAVSDSEVYVADFGEKRVIRFGKDGKKLGDLGPPDEKLKGRFDVPSPYGFDVAIGDAGSVWVTHTGQLSVQNYKDDATKVAAWGKQGNVIEGFSGCCNPTHIALRKDGTFVTSEKGLPRVKIHKPTGELVGVVAAPKDFAKGIHGLDVAVDPKDRILVTDTDTSTIRIYILTGGTNP